MGDGRSLPRTSLTFDDPWDLALLDEILLRATGLSERQHLRRKVLRMRIRDAAHRLEGKRLNGYWRVQDLRAQRDSAPPRDPVRDGSRLDDFGGTNAALGDRS